MSHPRCLRATVSGSFHRFIREVQESVIELEDLGVEVLSPAEPVIVGADGPFLYVASDLVRNMRLIQERHNECIMGSDLLWLVCPGGYMGLSATFELAVAWMAAVPVYGTTAPVDVTLRMYVNVVASIADAVAEAQALAAEASSRVQGLLVEPLETIRRVHADLDRIEDRYRVAMVDDRVREAVHDDLADAVRRMNTKLVRE